MRHEPFGRGIAGVDDSRPVLRLAAFQPSPGPCGATCCQWREDGCRSPTCPRNAPTKPATRMYDNDFGDHALAAARGQSPRDAEVAALRDALAQANRENRDLRNRIDGMRGDARISPELAKRGCDAIHFGDRVAVPGDRVTIAWREERTAAGNHRNGHWVAVRIERGDAILYPAGHSHGALIAGLREASTLASECQMLREQNHALLRQLTEFAANSPAVALLKADDVADEIAATYGMHRHATAPGTVTLNGTLIVKLNDGSPLRAGDLKAGDTLTIADVEAGKMLGVVHPGYFEQEYRRDRGIGDAHSAAAIAIAMAKRDAMAKYGAEAKRAVASEASAAASRAYTEAKLRMIGGRGGRGGLSDG